MKFVSFIRRVTILVTITGTGLSRIILDRTLPITILNGSNQMVSHIHRIC